MKVGIYFNTNPNQGGVYQYSLAVVETLKEIKNNSYVIISDQSDLVFYNIIQKYGSMALIPLMPILSRTKTLFLADILNSILYFREVRYVDSLNLDLVIYPKGSPVSYLSHTPYITSVHDLNHRINPQFPEVSKFGIWHWREYYFSRLVSKAVRVLVDSKKGMQDVIDYLGVPKNKITILPYLPPSYIHRVDVHDLTKISRKLKLPESFIFYPAKFWPHKNHINLLKAISLLKEKGMSISLVLTGSVKTEFSTLNTIRKYVDENNLTKQVKFLGYVTDTQLSAVYQKATAMIMPTFFGPTNIPVLEAWKMGTPVIYSNVDGCRQQLGKAGLLIDPLSPTSIARQISRLFADAKIAPVIIKAGHKRLNQWTNKEFSYTLQKTIKEISNAK